MRVVVQDSRLEMLREVESQAAAALAEQLVRVARAAVVATSSEPTQEEFSASRVSWNTVAALAFFLAMVSVQLETLLAILR